MLRSLTFCTLGFALSVLACGSLSLKPPTVMPEPSVDLSTAGASLAGSPAAIEADSLSPVPLHVGYGVRGPWFEVYFTDPSNPASPQMTGGLEERLVAAVDAARLSVHAAVFNITLNAVRDALVRAHRRGIDVRLVTESDNMDGEDLLRLVEAGIPVLGDRREGTMHNKFMVIDGTEVWTGSMNYTVSGTYLDNNTLMRIASTEMAANYEAEFAEMFEDDIFGDRTGRSTPHPHLGIDGTQVDALFSPDDDVEGELVDLLNSAGESINFLAFSFTSDALGDAIRRADRAGIRVRGVMDSEQASSNAGTEWADFASAGLDVRLDGNPGQMHEKVIIIDKAVVVLGSYNFSRNARETNDENAIVIHSRPIAEQFVLEFERIHALAEP